MAVNLGLTFPFTFSDVTRLLQVGGDLFVRTGLETFFLAYTTRAATRIRPDAGAAHQAICQVFGFRYQPACQFSGLSHGWGALGYGRFSLSAQRHDRGCGGRFWGHLVVGFIRGKRALLGVGYRRNLGHSACRDFLADAIDCCNGKSDQDQSQRRLDEFPAVHDQSHEGDSDKQNGGQPVRSGKKRGDIREK